MSASTDRETRSGPAVVASVLELDAASTEARLREVPDGCGFVEIRGDRLAGDEVAGLVRRAGRPVIVTVRRIVDGGAFDGSEDDRRRVLIDALDAGASFVDVEFGSALMGLLDGDRADRVILSSHGSPCRADELSSRLGEMAATKAGKLKLIPSCDRVSDVVAIRDLLRQAGNEGRLASFGLGRAGAVSRLLSPSWGSWATYGSAVIGKETAPGQFSVHEMLELHDVLRIAPETRLFGIVGQALRRSPSPAMHRAGYLETGIDARYLPIECDDADDALSVAGPGGSLGIEALAVTMPFKGAAFERCDAVDATARASGAVNTVVPRSDGWMGCNTDGPAILGNVRAKMDPRGAVVAVLGAGGFARAAASVLRDAGSEVVLFNRTLDRARSVAAELGVDARPLNELERCDWAVFVNATPLGLAGEDALDGASLRGPLVIDAVYGSETPLLRRARLGGRDTVDGFDLLVSQALPQFELMTGVPASEAGLRAAGRAWLT